MNLDLSLPLSPAFHALLLSSCSEAGRAIDPQFDNIQRYRWQAKESPRFSNGPVWSEWNLNELVSEVLEDLDLRIQEIQASVQTGELTTVIGDSIGIRALFQHLLTHAMKFRQPNIPPKIRISEEEGEQKWRIVFKDQEMGIKQEDQEKIFAIFHRLHSRHAFAGTGIGLAACKSLADSHQGG